MGRRLASLVVLFVVCSFGLAAADDPPAPQPNVPTDAPAPTPTNDPNAPAPAPDPNAPTNAPTTDAPATNAPVTNTPATNAPTTNAPTTPAPAAGPTIVTGKVTDVLGRPVANARVYVLPRRAQPHQTTTGKDGRYSVQVQTAGTHGVVIAIDRAHTFRTVLVQRGVTNTMDVDIELDTEGGEVIKIEDRRRPEPKVKAKPKHDVAKSLPYSEESVERDAWARAWLLLDVDERGTVTRLKLLKAPGFDLDKICIDEAFKLQFSPALDGSGRPMKTYMLWTFEWPAWGWLIQGNGTAVRRPVDRSDMEGRMANNVTRGIERERGDIIRPVGGPWATPTTAESAATGGAFETSIGRVPCAGSGPLNLDMRNRAYRDCSTPDLDAAPALPWITRETAEAAVAELANPNLMVEEVTEPGSRTPTIIAASVTAALTIASLVSFYKYTTATDRVMEYQWQATIDPVAYHGHAVEAKSWGQRTLVITTAAILSGGATMLIWHRRQSKRSFSVQPSEKGDGASALLSGRF